MNRRQLLRNCGAGLSALSITALSGCNALSGDGGDDSGGDGDADGDGSSGGGSGSDGDGASGGGNGLDGDSDGGDGLDGDSDGDEDAGAASPTQSPTATSPPSDATGQTSDGGTGLAASASSDVDGLAVEGTTVTDSGDQFAVDVTLQNTGEQTTDIFDYGYELTVYDGNGAEITGNGSGQGSINDTEIEPGESATITVRTDVDGSVDAVARYELVVNCSGMFVEGVYCEG